MYISRLEISGVKGFSGSRSVDLDLVRPDGSHAGWTVLAGRNASGKTSLLRAVVVGLGLHDPDDLSAWPVTEDAFIRITLSAQNPEELFWLRDGDDSEDPLPDDESAAFLAGPATAQVTSTWVRTRGREGEAPSRPRRLLRSTRITGGDGLLSYEVDSDVLEYTDLGCLIAVGAYRRLGREVGRGTGFRLPAVASLFDEEVSLSEGVFWLVDMHHRSLTGDEAAGELLTVVLALLQDGLLPDGHEVRKVDADGLRIARDGQEFTLYEMSDGYRSAVALVLHVLWSLATQGPGAGVDLVTEGGRPLVATPGIVLIDEVDAHLHVTWQQRIGYWLKAHFPDVQFLVTTHSPYICQAADPGGLIRLGAPGDSTPPAVVDQELYQRIVYGSGDDAILSDLFGLESPYSAAAEQARRRVGDLEGRVLSGDASESELAEYEELSNRLNSSLSARVIEVSARLAPHR